MSENKTSETVSEERELVKKQFEILADINALKSKLNKVQAEMADKGLISKGETLNW